MKNKVGVAILGVGRRGYVLLDRCWTEMADVEIKVICDPYLPRLEKAAELLKTKGLPEAILTTDSDAAINNPEVEAVVILTGWDEHAFLAEKSLLAGKYTAIEVGCAPSLQECFNLIEAHEKTGAPLMMLENCCYSRREMMVLNLVKQGLFGEIVHCAGGYHHELGEGDLFQEFMPEHPMYGIPHYRLHHYINRNCHNYPTHELGPIMKVLDIHHGNRMLSLTSTASKSRGLNEFAKNQFGADSEFANMNYKQGDIVSTIITCARGETIALTLDTSLIRPYYTRDFTVRGTKGCYDEARHTVFLKGMEADLWNSEYGYYEDMSENEEKMYEKYDHPLHEEYIKVGVRGGHGGADWLISRAFVEAVKAGTDTPINAYDTAALMSIAALSEKSIALGGAPVEIPDFTKGKWFGKIPKNEGKYSLDLVVADPDTSIVPQ